MASGVTVSDSCKTTYEEIKKDKKHRYVIVEVIGPRVKEYVQFLSNFHGLYDFEYMHQCQGTSESSKKQKLLLMSWRSDTAKVKKKMLYFGSFDALKKSLVGVLLDLSEASQAAVQEKLRATDRQ